MLRNKWNRNWSKVNALKVDRYIQYMMYSLMEVVASLIFFFTFVGCVNRYLSKEDVAQASLTKAQQEGGSIQLVTKEKQRSFTSALTPPAVHR